MFHRLATLLWVARAIGQEQTVKVQLVKVVVPGHSDNLDPTTYQTTDNIGLDTTVNQNDLFLSTFIITYNLLAAYFLHPVHRTIILSVITPLAFRRGGGGEAYLSHHDAMLTEHLGEATGINACDGGNLFSLEPRCQRLLSIPMTKLFTIVSHDECLGMDAVALHEQGKTIVTNTCIWHAVVANQWKCRYQYLPRIAGVCQTLWITRHGGVKDHLSDGLRLEAKRMAIEYCAIAEYQSCFFPHLFIVLSSVCYQYNV